MYNRVLIWRLWAPNVWVLCFFVTVLRNHKTNKCLKAAKVA